MEKDDALLLLKQQQRLYVDVTALQIVVQAIIATHPAPQALSQAIEREQQRYLAAAAPRQVPESDLDSIRAKIDRVLQTLSLQFPEA